ncbi:MAG: PDZ domain-containing protein [Bacteroidota bacterium]
MKNIYQISYSNPNSHCLTITYLISGLEGATTLVQLPTWRPGRYELGNFAKNIQRFEVTAENGTALPYQKKNSHLWEITLNGNAAIRVKYVYYAADLNAGSTFLGREQLYMNPVNCLMYQVNRLNVPCEIHLDIPEDYRVASSMEKLARNVFAAKNCHELFDSPFIASNTLKTHKMYVNGVEVQLHFQGYAKPDMQKLENDFARFFAHQMDIFGEFPTSEYHFLFQMLPHAFHHGVEHQANTVIAMGPAYAQFTTGYAEFLGISSHELFHAWNIKAIRPVELWPYDYTKENYTNLGYVAEGVTTLMGDLTLLRSGVWTQNEFWTEFGKECQKHFDNFGRLNYSVAESGFDSWLDGYSAGIPHRKVSIYTEGMLYAFVMDVMICKATGFSRSLYDVMFNLYHHYYKQSKGFSEEDYLHELKTVSWIDFKPFFEQYIWKASDDKDIINEALNYLGLTLDEVPSSVFHESMLGFKLTPSGLVTAVYPGSVAEKAGLWIDDKLVAVNGVEAISDLGRWMQFFGDEKMTLTINRQHKLIDIEVQADGTAYFHNYQVKTDKNLEQNLDNLEKWVKVRRLSKDELNKLS